MIALLPYVALAVAGVIAGFWFWNKSLRGRLDRANEGWEAAENRANRIEKKIFLQEELLERMYQRAKASLSLKKEVTDAKTIKDVDRILDKLFSE